LRFVVVLLSMGLAFGSRAQHDIHKHREKVALLAAKDAADAAR